ncbi:MBOAT family O-acyltransferase [Bradyrhizobium monzae]|uniref:MBOAT family O-acyltransferase n=1 Tax=Bradyrhizobium sp. Oc8 TaxID=2876780 RepID=UPI001F43420C|nr:MBOAT family O-acyltransferase [Bradyrhizobium sp. Oc8]
MLFNDYPFLLVFLPAALLIYRLVDPYPHLRIGVQVALSLAFYAWGSPSFILLLIASILINWLASIAYGRVKWKAVLTLVIVLDIGVLALFKYANFILVNLGHVLGATLPTLDIGLPLGISFFTFHHIMYLVDLKRGKAPLYALDRYALYIAFFPQAIAGPLARWSEVMHQFGRQVYVPGWQRQFCIAICFIALGLFQKVVIADSIAHLLDPIYRQAAAGALASGDAWLAFCFSFQILFDFSGYSDIAIGLGLLFGVQLPYNFNAPLRSTNIQDFWQRWHITLMFFLRDYVFYPLVNQRVLPRRFLPVQFFGAMLITMALCGLWHGASWAFVLWGVLHGVAQVVCSLWRRYGPRIPSWLGWALTVLFVLATGVIFRAGSVEAAWHVFTGLVQPLPLARGKHLWPLIVAPMFAFLLPASQDIVAFFTRRPSPWLAGVLGICLFALLLHMGGRDLHEFVYFKF